MPIVFLNHGSGLDPEVRCRKSVKGQEIADAGYTALVPPPRWRRRNYVFDVSVCLWVRAYAHALSEAISDRLAVDFYFALFFGNGRFHFGSITTYISIFQTSVITSQPSQPISRSPHGPLGSYRERKCAENYNK